MADTPLLPGTLDLRVLKAVSPGSEHGYGLRPRIQRASGDVLAIEQGALYPAPFRPASLGRGESEWGVPDSNRKAKSCTPTRAGRARLAREVDTWRRLSQAMDAVLGASRAGLAS